MDFTQLCHYGKFCSAWSPYSRNNRKLVLETIFPKRILQLPRCRLQKSVVRDCYYQKHASPVKNCLLTAPAILTASLAYGQLFKISSIIPNVFVTHIPAFANSCCKNRNEFYFPDRSAQVIQFTAIIFQ